MKKILAVRPINLVIIAATMICMRYCLVIPLLNSMSEAMSLAFVSLLSLTDFILLVLSLVLIAAGGYIINDLNDQVEDRANGKVRETFSMSAYYIISALGLFIGVYVGQKLATYNLALIHMSLVVSLWFYANYLKGTILLGNAIVAFCTAMAPLAVGIFEVVPLQLEHAHLVSDYPNFSFNFIAYWTIGFAVFAFLFTLIREAIKDVQDVQGDSLAGKETLPVAYGERFSRIWISVLHVSTISALWYVYYSFVTDQLTFITAVIISAVLIYQTVAIWMAKTPKNWGVQSSINKALSLVGLLYALGISYMLHNGVLL